MSHILIVIEYGMERKNMRIPIVMVTDINYISQTRVTIWTMGKNAEQDTILDITILCSEKLEEDGKNRLYELETFFINLRICFYEIHSDIFQNAKPLSYIPIASFYRLVIQEALNEDKCLFLDGDLIVNTDLKNLYLQDIDDYYIAGVRDVGFIIEPELAIRHFEKYNFEKYKNYINAGVILFNLLELRKNDLQSQFLEYIKTPYPYMDQDILNKVCENKIKLLDWKYNFFNRCTPHEFLLKKSNNTRENWEILHFAGKYKPWNNIRIRGAKEWWKWGQEALEKNEYEKMYDKARKMTKESDWSYILKRCLKEKEIIVIGYSHIGMEVFRTLKSSELTANIYIGDNSKIKQDLSNESITIYPIEQLITMYPNDSALWINTSQNRYTEINIQLEKMGVNEEQIIQYINKGESYFAVLDNDYLNYELQQIYLMKNIR